MFEIKPSNHRTKRWFYQPQMGPFRSLVRTSIIRKLSSIAIRSVDLPKWSISYYSMVFQKLHASQKDLSFRFAPRVSDWNEPLYSFLSWEEKSTRQITASPEWLREKFSNFSCPGPGQNEYVFYFQDRKANRCSFESASQGKNFETEYFY